jgi:hypothetical protein
MQSKTLAIVCPRPPGRSGVTRGVKDEIDVAAASQIVCHYWQNPEWDPDKRVASQFGMAAGSMGLGPTQALMVQVETLEDLIKATA